MIHQQKHLDQPMSLLFGTVRHGGRYVQYYFGLDRTYSTIFADFYYANRQDFYPAGNRMDTVHRTQDRHRHNTLCRPAGGACSRCLPSFFPGARWDMSQSWKLPALMLVRTLHPKGTITLALDDTLFHRSGRKVDGAAWWRDAVRSTKKNIACAWGLNLVVLTLQLQPLKTL
jgi:hypothetical protein